MGAHTNAKDLAPECLEVEAIAEGFRLVYSDEHDHLEHNFRSMMRFMPTGRIKHSPFSNLVSNLAARLILVPGRPFLESMRRRSLHQY